MDKPRTGFIREKAWLTESPISNQPASTQQSIDLGVPAAVQVQSVLVSINNSAVAGNRQFFLAVRRGNTDLYVVETQFNLGPGLGIQMQFSLLAGVEMQGNEFWTVPLGDIIAIHPTTIVVGYSTPQAGDGLAISYATHWLWNN